MANDCKGLEGMVLNERSPGEVEYLKKSLGPALVAGLAEVCMQKPANPVEYLGQWLLRKQTNGEDQAIRRGVQTRSTQTTPDLQGADPPISGNPFLIDIIIELMVKKADVNTLKTFRNMDTIWNQLAIKELEKRALKNQLRELNLTKKWSQEEELTSFLEDTAAIPQLFHSFRVNFPNSINPIFFANYTPIFLHLKFDKVLKFTYSLTKTLYNLFSWMAPTVQELEVKGFFEGEDSSTFQKVIAPLGNEVALVFQKLTKLIWKFGDCEDSLALFNIFLDKARCIDPTPNLTNLEVSNDVDFNQILNNSPNLSRWSQLTHLRIGECSDDGHGIRSIGGLLSLGQAGMCLKMFAIILDFGSPFEESPQICQNLSEFLEIQSKSLEVLEFVYFLGGEGASEEIGDPIKLPIFANLHTLHLFLFYGVTPGQVLTPIFGRIQVLVHFPKLDHLSANQRGFLDMFPLGGKPIRLKSLNFCDSSISYPIQEWTCNFPTVESLRIQGDLIKDFWDRGVELPWVEGLKVLEIEGVNFPLKMARFTSLRKLIVRETSYLDKFVSYLAFFRQVLRLQLSSITFKSPEEPSEDVRAFYTRHFPFPVKFEQSFDAHQE